MGKLTEYRIAFSGLKLGEHNYELSAREAFFEKYHNLEVEHGDVKVNLVLNKKERMLVFDFHLEGWIELTCDRCLGKYKHFLKDDEKLYVKRQNGIYEMSEESEDVLIIPDDWSDFDVAHYIYEFIALLIPMKKVHPNDQDGKPLCDPKMIEILKKIEVGRKSNGEGQEDIDPRWEALKNLKKNK